MKREISPSLLLSLVECVDEKWAKEEMERLLEEAEEFEYTISFVSSKEMSKEELREIKNFILEYIEDVEILA